jgi:hypothetical protein
MSLKKGTDPHVLETKKPSETRFYQAPENAESIFGRAVNIENYRVNQERILSKGEGEHGFARKGAQTRNQKQPACKQKTELFSALWGPRKC